jgi:hypothetical protein
MAAEGAMNATAAARLSKSLFMTPDPRLVFASFSLK